MNLKLFYFVGIAAFLTACNPTKKTDGMSDFSNDAEFKKAHEQPTAIAFKPKGETLTFQTPDGKTGSAYFLKKKKSQQYLFVIHEWWGLNDHIKQEAERLAAALGEKVNVLALDMYDGQVASNPDDAGKFMKSVTPERAEAIVKGALAFAGAEAQIATIGWCFGGGWSLKSAILAGSQAVGCVIYYGMPVQKAEELAPLQAGILGIFAKNDKWINPDVVKSFDDLTKATGKTFTFHLFEADHAFANPSSPRYVETAAQEANALSLAFLKEKFNID